MQSKLKKRPNKKSLSYQPLVLVVDNDRDNLLLASYVIESLGLLYVFTDNSEECLNFTKKLLPDIILLDIVMPKLNGLEITRIIKQDPKTFKIPIIAVTGLTREKHISEIRAAGCDDYLCKPYLIEDLESKICAYLKRPLA